MVNFYIGLIHYPVYNRRGEIITTAVTNFDLHDIARTAVTYGAAGYYIVHDQPGQREIIGEILAYWQEGAGSRHNPDRNQALSVVRLAENLDEVCRAIERENGGLSPFVVATAARLAEGDRRLDTEQLRCLARTGRQPILLLFGTGWGMCRDFIRRFHCLEPIAGRGLYNHLSVRAAVAIVLDRILGR